MSRWIDADALKQNINTAFWSEIGKIIEDAPSIDIVRCKECKYGDVLDHYESGCCGCKNGLLGYITADDFCSYGEREGE